MNQSETSSNLSYVSKSAFNPPKQSLDIIKEDQEQKDDEDEDEQDGYHRGPNNTKNNINGSASSADKSKTDHIISGIKVGEKAKSGVKSYVGKGGKS